MSARDARRNDTRQEARRGAGAGTRGSRDAGGARNADAGGARNVALAHGSGAAASSASSAAGRRAARDGEGRSARSGQARGAKERGRAGAREQRGADRREGARRATGKDGARRSQAASARNAASPREDHKRRPTNPLLPVLALVVSLVVAVLIMRMGVRVSDRVLEANAAAAASVAAYYEDPAEVVEEYKGVEDPWTDTLLFTTGNAELDTQVKTFCDALSKNKDSAEKNAQAVYNVIVQSTYEPRTAADMPSGADWALGAAHHYFMYAKPKEGEGGTGDAYEFAAVTAYCLRYFGYEDALAAPIVNAQTGGEIGSAICLVTDKKGAKCVCDPYYNVNGWMLSQDSYKSIVIDDIGQDLEPFEKMGFGIRHRDASMQSTSGTTLTGTGSYTDASQTSN